MRSCLYISLLALQLLLATAQEGEGEQLCAAELSGTASRAAQGRGLLQRAAETTSGRPRHHLAQSRQQLQKHAARKDGLSQLELSGEHPPVGDPCSAGGAALHCTTSWLTSKTDQLNKFVRGVFPADLAAVHESALAQESSIETQIMLAPAVARWLLSMSFFVVAIVGLLVLMGCCCLQYRKPSDDMMIDSPPQLEPTVEATGDGSEQQVAQPFLLDKSVGLRPHTIAGSILGGSGERIFIMPTLGGAGGTYGSLTEICDSDGIVVMKVMTAVPSRTDWYHQRMWQMQQEGPMNIARATPWARMFGVTVREPPVVSLHGASSPLTPMVLGPKFVSCRFVENEGKKEEDKTGAPRRLHLYDANDAPFAHVDGSEQPVSPTGSVQPGGPHYTLLQPSDGLQLSFEGSFAKHQVTIKDVHKKKVAYVEPAGSSNGPQFYRLRVVQGIDWNTVVVMLIAVLSIEVEEAEMKPAPTS